MNKKFLSAILFGALMVTSTGTFVSCKDYDDDIDNLQTQINANTSAIAELKSLIGDGNYVTSVTLNGKNLVVATKNGSTTLALPECEDEVGTICKIVDNELYIDGVATGIKVAEQTEENEFLPAVKIDENGEWAVLQEDNSYLSTGVLASSVTAVQNADKSWTLTVKDAEGNVQEVKVPSAASLLTDLNVIGNAYTDETAQETVLKIARYTFGYKANSGTAPARDKWTGPRGVVPADGWIFAQMNEIYAQINPTTIDATEVDFSLVDSKNNNPSKVNLSAYAYTDLQTRAANANGMYVFTMDDVYFANSQSPAKEYYVAQFKSDGKLKEYALTAGGSVRSAYTIAYEEGETKELNEFNFNNAAGKDQIEGDADVDYRNTDDPNAVNSTIDAKIDLNQWYEMNLDNKCALWDMDIDVPSDYKTLYGIELKEEAGYWAFRATKTPDNVTRAAFPLYVRTIAKNGEYNEAIVIVRISSKISDGVTYDAISHKLSENTADNAKAYDVNFFSIDLSKLKDSMNADDLATWNIKANKIVGTIYNANYTATYNATAENGIEPMMVTSLKGSWAANVGKKTASPAAASDIVFLIDNKKAAETLGSNATDKQFYMNVKFYEDNDANNDTDDNFLNELTVPFTLTLPAITELFEIAPGYLNADGVANLYMYEEDFKSVVTTTGAATFKMSRIFSKFSTNGFEIMLNGSDKIGETNTTSAKLAYLNKETAYVTGTAGAKNEGVVLDATSLAYLTLYQGANGLGGEAGYAEALKLDIYGKYDAAWTYPSDETFKFEAKVLSPIEQGQVVPKNGNVVTLTAASKDAELGGYKLNNTHITGVTYNTQETYNVLPDILGTIDNPVDWTRNDIYNVEATPGDTNQYFTVSTVKPATADKDDATKVGEDGYFLLKGNNLTSTVESSLKVKVTDIWKRSVTSTVPVKITVE